MRVNLAAQVLSSTVAAGISALVALKNLPQEALTTAKFVKKFDSLFNAFNSRCTRSSQPLAHALSEASGHTEFLQDCLQYISQLRIPNGPKIHCLRGWKISIRALLALWDDLQKESDFKFLLTSRLNQDCVENLFSIIRGKGGKRDNTDAREVRAAFRKVAFDQLLSPSKGSNCDAKIDAILLSISSLGNGSMAISQPSDVGPSGIQHRSKESQSRIYSTQNQCDRQVSVVTSQSSRQTSVINVHSQTVKQADVLSC